MHIHYREGALLLELRFEAGFVVDFFAELFAPVRFDELLLSFLA